jgi:hypothetical protein
MLALAFERAACGEDLLGEVPRRVGAVVTGCGGARSSAHRLAAGIAETGAVRSVVPQIGQTRASDTPQPSQNLASSRLSWPQEGQWIEPSTPDPIVRAGLSSGRAHDVTPRPA